MQRAACALQLRSRSPRFPVWHRHVSAPRAPARLPSGAPRGCGVSHTTPIPSRQRGGHMFSDSGNDLSLCAGSSSHDWLSHRLGFRVGRRREASRFCRESDQKHAIVLLELAHRVVHVERLSAPGALRASRDGGGAGEPAPPRPTISRRSSRASRRRCRSRRSRPRQCRQGRHDRRGAARRAMRARVGFRPRPS